MQIPLLLSHQYFLPTFRIKNLFLIVIHQLGKTASVKRVHFLVFVV
ncbi:teichoic acid glycosylation protein [Listeria monocytogenes]|nr:teichoic acid glycosylation protein [Listeria monocytogenes]